MFKPALLSGALLAMLAVIFGAFGAHYLKTIFTPELLRKKCTDCHSTQDWYAQKDGKGFDHSKTHFALTGAHMKISCAQCHGRKENQVFKFNTENHQFCTT